MFISDIQKDNKNYFKVEDNAYGPELSCGKYVSISNSSKTIVNIQFI